MPNTSKLQIGLFLADLKNALENEIFIVKTDKNKKTIAELGFTHQDIKDVISDLKIEDYSDGPLPGKQTSNDLWVFGTIIENREIYIKIEISKFTDVGLQQKTAYIISFHDSEHKMTYPLKK
jgi:hypothetical protein